MQPDIIDMPHAMPAAPVRSAPAAQARVDRPSGSAGTTKGPSNRRYTGVLLASAAVIVVATGGIGWFLLHPSHHPTGAVHKVHVPPASVAHQAVLVAPDRATHAPDKPAAGVDESGLQEMMAFRDPGSPAHPADKSPKSLGASASPGEGAVTHATVGTASPVEPPRPPSTSVTTHMPTLGPLPPVVVVAKAPVAAIGPADAADRAAHLQAAPLAPQEQVQVLNLVTEEATLIRQQREQLAELRKDQQNLHTAVDQSIADFNRRLSLREANDGVAAARVLPTAPVEPDVTGPLAQARQAVATAGSNQPPAVAAPSGPHSYRIQAASPSLAMVSDQNPAPGASPLLQVQIGDDLPGYGRVLSIGQRGTAWFIRAEHGTVQ